MGIIWDLITGHWQWLAGAVGVILAAFGLRKSGKDAVLAKQARDAAKRAEKGRKGAGKAAKDIREGKKPDDVVRDNDGDWQ